MPEKKEYQETAQTSTAYRKVWAEKMLKNYESLSTEVPYTIQRISLSEDFNIIGMEGEVCIEYDIYLKNKYWKKTIITAGYCNGIIGYIPTEVMFEQGGYEPADSIACYELPTRFTDEVEEIIKKGLDELLK
jgi:hypothetical protein